MFSYYQTILVFFPTLGALFLIISQSIQIHRIIAIIVSVITFFLSLTLLTYSNIHYGELFALLTTLTIPSALLAGWESVRKNSIIYYASILVLESCLLGVFLSSDVITFYVTFEAALIPLFLLIGLFGGSNSQRASYLLFLYTLLGSLFILIGLLILIFASGSIYFTAIKFAVNGSYNTAWLFIFFALAVKTPLVPLHIWLPRAHAEAPVGGSIILAGLVLKLATFGYLRLLLEILPQSSSYFTPLVQTIAIISIIYASLAALRQVDTKALVAVSSVAHISIVVLGLFSNSLIGLTGAIVLSLAHGFISPALFFLIGGVLYDRFHVRIIRYYRGLLNSIPLFTLFFFFASIGNIGVPFSMNFVGEFLSIIGAFERSPVVGSFAAFSVVLAAAYGLWLYARVSIGRFSPYLLHASDLNRREFNVLIPWISLTLIWGLFPAPVLQLLHSSLSSLLY